MKDSVEKWYKKGAENLNVIPPHQAWKNVERTLEDWPKHWYQSNFAAVDHETSQSDWEKLAIHLEIARNSRAGQRQFVMRTAAIAAAVVMLPLWLMNVVPTTTSYESLQYVSNTTPTTTALASSSEVTPVSTASTLELGIANPTTSALTAMTTNDNDADVSLNEASITQANNSTTPQSLPALNIPAMDVIVADELTEARNNSLVLAQIPAPLNVLRLTEPNENIVLARNNRSKWSIAPTAVFGRATLINPITFRDDATTIHDMHAAYGLSASYRLKKSALTMDLLFNDSKKQAATIGSESLSTKLGGTTLTFQYERFVPIFKQSQKFKPELYAGFGVFGSYLKNATTASSVNESTYSSFTYKKMDFGGVLTAGSSFRLNDKLRFNTGIRLQSGIINLFEGRDKIPSDYFRTQSLSLGVQAKLSYMF